MTPTQPSACAWDTALASSSFWRTMYSFSSIPKSSLNREVSLNILAKPIRPIRGQGSASSDLSSSITEASSCWVTLISTTGSLTLCLMIRACTPRATIRSQPCRSSSLARLSAWLVLMYSRVMSVMDGNVPTRGCARLHSSWLGTRTATFAMLLSSCVPG